MEYNSAKNLVDFEGLLGPTMIQNWEGRKLQKSAHRHDLKLKSGLS